MAREVIAKNRLARNIDHFAPHHAGYHNVHGYLQDIDFHLQTNVTTQDWLYLIWITFSLEVWSILAWTSNHETHKS